MSIRKATSIKDEKRIDKVVVHIGKCGDLVG